MRTQKNEVIFCSEELQQIKVGLIAIKSSDVDQNVQEKRGRFLHNQERCDCAFIVYVLNIRLKCEAGLFVKVPLQSSFDVF